MDKTSKTKKYTVKCPICGGELCKVKGDSDEITIKCSKCNSPLVVTRTGNSLMVREEMFYESNSRK